MGRLFYFYKIVDNDFRIGIIYPLNQSIKTTSLLAFLLKEVYED